MINDGTKIKLGGLLMIDDNQNKLNKAKIARWETILFENPEQLREELRSYNLL